MKISGLVAKLAVLCTAASAVAALFDTIQAEMGGVIDAICVATYLFAKSLSGRGYDKTLHVSPRTKE